MGHSQADKAQSRERILSEAAAQIRETGLESVSVAGLMKRANLTHGGFYGHFKSRSDLLAQALKRALVDGEATARARAEPGKERSFANMVRSYLSRTHRDARDSGCAIAALVSDVGRADADVRAVMAPHIESYIKSIASKLETADDRKAIAAVSAMVGALAISRVMVDQKRADEILRAVREHVLALQPGVGDED